MKSATSDLIQNYIAPFNGLATHPWLKAVLSILSAFGTFLWGIFSNDWQWLGLITAAVFADSFTGVRAARRRGELIKSYAMRRTTAKLGDYWVVGLISIGISNVLPAFWWVAPAACSWMSLTEFQSMLENTGMTGLLEQLKEKMRSIIPTKKGDA